MLFVACNQNPTVEVSNLPEIIVPQLPDHGDAEELIGQLGCYSCHSGLSLENTIMQKAPNLTRAGKRYRPGYLFNYLQNPTRVRNHIGVSRMPDFGFSASESLALTLYLSNESGGTHEVLEEIMIPEASSNPEKGEEMFNKLSCTVCHSINEGGNPVVSDLSYSGSKLYRDWTVQFLAAPHKFQGNENVMPSFFYNEASIEIFENSGVALSWVTDFLMDSSNDSLSIAYSSFKEQSSVTASQGKRIFESQNCAACHKSSIQPKSHVSAPDLKDESKRVNKDWFQRYLANPEPIRPFGYPAGAGNRMPDFKLSKTEIDQITSFLYKDEVLPSVTFANLSAFKLKKTESILINKLSCTGCHILGDGGGRIGPNLNEVSLRLKYSYLHDVIKNPHKTDSMTMMPTPVLTEDRISDLISTLNQNQWPAIESNYLSLIDHEPVDIELLSGSGYQYQRFCAACHGVTGNGDGYNAGYLIKPPTAHNDPGVMSQRPDDTLFDGIYVGGFILNKSHQMPGWGQTLTTTEIRNLVDYMRNLCNCKGPDWANNGHEK